MTATERLRAAFDQRGGFLTDDDVAAARADEATRLTQMLVRCSGCRFIAAAQDVAHLIAIIEADGRDFVRDVSLFEFDPEASYDRLVESFVTRLPLNAADIERLRGGRSNGGTP